MVIARSFLIISLYLPLSLLVRGQTATGAVQQPEIIYGQTSFEWPTPAPDKGLLLTVSGPGGLYLRQDYAPGNWARLMLVDDEGNARPDGVYKWELIVQAGWEALNQVQSGWFKIQQGTVVAEGIGQKLPAFVEENAPENSIYINQRGLVGVGTSVPGAQLHVKGTDASLAVEDTQPGGREYRLRSQQKGDGSLGLFDQTAGKARWLVDGEGRVGINTTRPTSTLTVDGYIETTKGFLVNGTPMSPGRIGLFGGSQPLYTETNSNNFFGTNPTTNTGDYNSFFGHNAGHSNTSASFNSFFGMNAGYSNTTASFNSFFGSYAGFDNTTGGYNSFFGDDAGSNNQTGDFNSFFGSSAGYSNVTAFSNSFFGSFAGHSNETGSFNSFFGANAGSDNETGYRNSFFGEDAGYHNQTGNYNSAFGEDAGYSNTIGSKNSFFGAWSDTVSPDSGLPAVTNASAIGAHAFVSQSNSLVLGSIAGVNGGTSYVNVGIGTSSPVRQLHLRGPNATFRMDRSANTAAFILCRTDDAGNVWKSFIVGTDGYGVDDGEFIISDSGTGAGGASVNRMTIQNNGNVVFTGNVSAPNFIPTSSIALKTNVRTLDSAISVVNRLRGVRFDWKSTGEPAVGLIAEEVDQVIPEVVSHDTKDGKAQGVNYSSLVAVLVEAVKEQQATIREQQKTLEDAWNANLRERSANAEQQAEIDNLKAEVEKLKELLKGK